jgi:hypothetical protein
MLYWMEIVFTTWREANSLLLLIKTMTLYLIKLCYLLMRISISVVFAATLYVYSVILWIYGVRMIQSKNEYTTYAGPFTLSNNRISNIIGTHIYPTFFLYSAIYTVRANILRVGPQHKCYVMNPPVLALGGELFFQFSMTNWILTVSYFPSFYIWWLCFYFSHVLYTRGKRCS